MTDELIMVVKTGRVNISILTAGGNQSANIATTQ